MIEAPKKSKIKRAGSAVFNFSHNLAHGVGEKVVQPLINASQYNTFENPEKHKIKIDRQMFRTFHRAESTLRKDNLASKFLFAQFVVAVALGEHVPIPVSWLPFIPHQFDNIPLPFDVHVNIPIPPAHLLNLIPNVHVPTELAVNGPYWPLLTSDIFMSTAVNIPNAIRAYREKRFSKAAWYTLSIPGAFTHVPFVFNSFWFELATRPAERKAGQVFAEKVNYVLEGSDIPPSGKLPEEPKSKFGKAINHIPYFRKLREKMTGEIHIHPKDRHIFAEAVQMQLSRSKSQSWWETHLEQINHDIVTSPQLGLPHAAESIQKHEQQKVGSKFPKNLWHTIMIAYHKHMRERLEEKQETVKMTEDFIKLSQKQPTV